MKNLTQRGFTLIELLVVIAIIGILAGILFVAIDPSQKVKDAGEAKIMASLQGVPTAATVFYTSNDYSYDGLCAATALSGLTAGDDDTCTAAGQEWAFQLDDGKATPETYYCIDNDGDGIVTATSSMISGATDYDCN